MRQVPRTESAELRRFWLWAVAAVMALALLIAVAKWAARQETPAVRLLGAHSGMSAQVS